MNYEKYGTKELMERYLLSIIQTDAQGCLAELEKRGIEYTDLEDLRMRREEMESTRRGITETVDQIILEGLPRDIQKRIDGVKEVGIDRFLEEERK